MKKFFIFCSLILLVSCTSTYKLGVYEFTLNYDLITKNDTVNITVIDTIFSSDNPIATISSRKKALIVGDQSINWDISRYSSNPPRYKIIARYGSGFTFKIKQFEYTCFKTAFFNRLSGGEEVIKE